MQVREYPVCIKTHVLLVWCLFLFLLIFGVVYLTGIVVLTLNVRSLQKVDVLEFSNLKLDPFCPTSIYM